MVSMSVRSLLLCLAAGITAGPTTAAMTRQEALARTEEWCRTFGWPFQPESMKVKGTKDPGAPRPSWSVTVRGKSFSAVMTPSGKLLMLSYSGKRSDSKPALLSRPRIGQLAMRYLEMAGEKVAGRHVENIDDTDPKTGRPTSIVVTIGPRPYGYPANVAEFTVWLDPADGSLRAVMRGMPLPKFEPPGWIMSPLAAARLALEHEAVARQRDPSAFRQGSTLPEAEVLAPLMRLEYRETSFSDAPHPGDGRLARLGYTYVAPGCYVRVDASLGLVHSTWSTAPGKLTDYEAEMRGPTRLATSAVVVVLLVGGAALYLLRRRASSVKSVGEAAR
jgi:hypothetical protein